jgi:Flp pilus assembly pilin Flp
MINVLNSDRIRLRRALRVLAQRLRRSRGVSAIEYGLMIALISCVILGSLSSLGTTLFSGIYTAMTAVAAIT